MLQQLAVELGEWTVLDGRMSSGVLDSLVDSFSMGLAVYYEDSPIYRYWEIRTGELELAMLDRPASHRSLASEGSRMRLETKCISKGMHFVKVDRWFASSQMCSACGFVNKETKELKIREWECPECHTRHDRDANASLNVAREGYRLIARLPMDGGEVTPVETDKVDESAKAPKKPDVGETGRVPETSSLEAPRL